MIGALVVSVLLFAPLSPDAAVLTVEWTDNSGGMASTLLERRDVGAYAPLAEVPPGQASYVDAAVVAGTAYCYRARAHLSETGETSDYSNEACAIAPSPASVVVTLSVNGAGKVSSNPAGIDRCSGICAATYLVGAIVTLTALPNNRNFVFVGWTGPCAGAPATCVFLVDGPTAIDASFRRK